MGGAGGLYITRRLEVRESSSVRDNGVRVLGREMEVDNAPKAPSCSAKTPKKNPTPTTNFNFADSLILHVLHGFYRITRGGDVTLSRTNG